jgi:excinuclease ABC subunit C
MNLQNFQKTKLPDAPGVYFFLNAQKKPLYIGKATSLKDRVKSYFAKDIEMVRSPLIAKMVLEAKSIEVKETKSVLEALLLEADLIKKFKPKFNTKEKDDKSFNCLVITEEAFPQLLVIRKKDIDLKTLHTTHHTLQTIYGPFTNGGQLRVALRLIQKIFPFRDEKCHLDSKRPCFNFTLGLCPGTCVGKVTKQEYAQTIKQITKLLSGNISGVAVDLTKEMDKKAGEQKFEEARRLRDKIYALEHINDISLIKEEVKEDISKKKFRIESFDIAHMMGKDMVGAMVVMVDGELSKKEYKKFIIKTCDNANDPKALREVLTRRFNHPEWIFPDMLVVDGGTTQVNVAFEVVASLGLAIPVVAVVKDSHHKAKGLLGREDLVKKYKKEILFINTETHRMAIGFHKQRRKKSFLSK